MTNTTSATNPTPSPFKKVLKKSLYILLSVMALLLIVGIFMPRKINTIVKANIEAPKSYVFNLLNNPTNVSLWNDWVKSDSKIKLNFNNIKEGKGAGYSWESEKMGTGSINYIDIIQDEKIVAELTMGDRDKSTYIQSLSETNGKTTLEWNFNGEMNYPTNVLIPLFKYMMKKSFNKSISNIKEELEKRKKGIYNGYQVKEKSQNQKHYVTSRSNVKIPEIGQYYQQNIAAVYKKLLDNGIATIGAPALLFYSYDEIKPESDLAIGVPVLNPVNIKELSSQTLPAQNTIYVDHYGDMALTGEGHLAINAYMKDRKIPQKYPLLEEYITDPLKEKDMKKWLTKITYYVGETK